MSELEIYDKQGFGHSSGFGSKPALLIVDFVNNCGNPYLVSQAYDVTLL